MYVLPKIHKNPIALRPIVTTVNSVTYNLAKFLHGILKSNFPLPDICSINNLDFIENLKLAKVFSNSIMFSLDVKSLFTSIPSLKLKTILYEKLNSIKISDCENLLSKADIIELLEICFEENFFSINNEWFFQKDGLFMGHILSPILANIYMSYFLNIAKDLKNFPNFIKLYVDDIFGIFNGTKRQLEKFFSELNLIRPNNISFTLETEINNKISYLDLLLNREKKISIDLF